MEAKHRPFFSPLSFLLHFSPPSATEERVDVALKEQYFRWICITEGEYVYRIPNSILLAHSFEVFPTVCEEFCTPGTK